MVFEPQQLSLSEQIVIPATSLPQYKILRFSILGFKCTQVYKVRKKEKSRKEANTPILSKGCVYTPRLLGLVLRKSLLTVTLCYKLGQSTSFWPWEINQPLEC